MRLRGPNSLESHRNVSSCCTEVHVSSEHILLEASTTVPSTSIASLRNPGLGARPDLDHLHRQYSRHRQLLEQCNVYRISDAASDAAVDGVMP